jgi:hypothetical protein
MVHYSLAIAMIFLFWQIHFGESSMQKCEIMLNDLIDSKRTNSNIKTSLLKTSQTGTAQVLQVPLRTNKSSIILQLFIHFF